LTSPWRVALLAARSGQVGKWTISSRRIVETRMQTLMLRRAAIALAIVGSIGGARDGGGS